MFFTINQKPYQFRISITKFLHQSSFLIFIITCLKNYFTANYEEHFFLESDKLMLDWYHDKCLSLNKEPACKYNISKNNPPLYSKKLKWIYKSSYLKFICGSLVNTQVVELHFINHSLSSYKILLTQTRPQQ